jgi:hypothetical protein
MHYFSAKKLTPIAAFRQEQIPRRQSGFDNRTSNSRGVMIWIPKGFPSAGKSPSRGTMIFAPAPKAQAK